MVPAVVARVSARGPRPRRATRRSEPTRGSWASRRVPLSLGPDEADSERSGRLKPYSGKPNVRNFRGPAGNRAGWRTEAPPTERGGKRSDRPPPLRRLRATRLPENAETNPCDMPERTLWASHYRLMVPLYKFGPERDRSKSPRQCTASTTVTRMHPMLRYRIRRILYAP